MVDVLSTRVHAAYSKWEQPPDHRNAAIGGKLSFQTLKRIGVQQRREKVRAVNMENLKQARDRDLFRSKESPWMGFPSRSQRPIMGMACKACTPKSQDTLSSSSSNNKSIQNILKTDAENADSFLTRSFCHLVHNYQLKKFDYPQVANTVLQDERMKEAIEDTTKELVKTTPAEEQSDELYKQIFTAQEARARRILYDMRSTLSDLLLRITSWLLYKLLPRFLTSVCLHPSQLDMLKKAASTNLPLIFVPLHRSHLDYILITFILLNINVKSPLVAAGNNLRIPVFGWLLRGLGAFFIKRRIDPVDGKKDTIYRAVLHTYMMQCLRSGHNIEFYIEGGRTRTGKPNMPKGGLLSVIVDAYMDGTVEDALLVPVSVNYDKLVDGNFIRELLGQPKQMETFSAAMSGIWSVLNSNYGSMRIDFNQPFSLKELVKSFETRNRRLSTSDLGGSDQNLNVISVRNGFHERPFHSIPSTNSLYGTDVVDENHRVLVESIARHLIYDSAKACAVMSTNTLAFLLLNKFREGVTMDELVISFDKLRQQLLSENKDVGFTGDSIDVVNNALRLLGPGLVKRERKKKSSDSTEYVEVITPVTMLPNVIELSYYSNALLPHFMLEGVMATAICSAIKEDASSNTNEIKVSEDVIIRHAIEICDILQFEFIFTKPCEQLDYALSDVIDKFRTFEILRTEEKILLENEQWSQRYAKNFDSEDEDEFVQSKPSPVYTVNEKEESDKLELFHMTLRPLIDTYTVTAKCLHRLIGRQVPENEFVQEVLSEIKSQLSKGFCSYGECSSVEPIKNAFRLFKKWGVVEFYTQDKIKLIYLTDDYNEETNVSQVFNRINFFKFNLSKKGF